MATIDIENIKARIDKLKSEKAHAEGQKQSIEDTWKRDFDVDTLEAAKSLLATMQQELDEHKAKQQEYLEAADKLLTEAGV